MSDESPLEEVLAEVLAHFQRDIYTALPGRVQSFDSGTQTASVEIVVREPDRSFPILPKVPVVFPRSGGYALTMPVSGGTTGLLIFTSLDMTAWRNTNSVTVPIDGRRHSISSAAFYPGLVPAQNALDTYDQNAIVLGRPDATTPEFVALANLVNAQLQRIHDTITNWTPVAQDGGTALKTAWGLAFPTGFADTSADDVKAT
jgi:hypothetical protein